MLIWRWKVILAEGGAKPHRPEPGDGRVEIEMNNNELKRLNRTELLELLLAESKRNRELEKTLQQVKEQLADRELRVERAGTLAEAAMSVNQVFEAADAAAAQYLAGLRMKSEEADRAAAELLAKTRRQCETMLRQAELKAEVIVSEAKLQAKKYAEQAEKSVGTKRL